MIIDLAFEEPAAVAADWLCVPVFEKDDASLARLPEELRAIIARLIASKDIGTSVGDTTPVLAVSGIAAERLLVIGLGSKSACNPGTAFQAGFAGGKRVSNQQRSRIAALVPDCPGREPRQVASALVAGFVSGTRGPGLRKSEPARKPFERLSLVVGPVAEAIGAELEAAIRHGHVVGEAVGLARDLANTPPAEKPPRALAERIAEVMRRDVKVEVWDRDRIAQERFGGLLGVSAGSDEPPAFVILNYQGGGDSAPTALVGKGVTFDSGGLSLKPSASMEDMKADMTGAAVVAAVIWAAAELKLERNLVGYLPLTENLTGGRAMKLGDVLKMRNGKTIEILNTDAEGRLILADALSYAVERKPAKILDLATLTGACMVALGPKVAGLFSNHDGFAAEIASACAVTGERAWRMPLDADFLDMLKSQVADHKNIGGKYGGAITAAKFLEQFVAETPWVHLDIAGPSWSDNDNATHHSGATACFVRTLIAWLEAA